MSDITLGRLFSSRRWGVLAAGAVLVGAMAGCSSSSKSAVSSTSTSGSSSPTVGSASAAGQTSSCASTPGVTPTQVKVGALWSQTGPDASYLAPFGPAVQARIKVQNQQGGVNGRQIVVANADDGSNPGQSLASAQGLVESNGVFAVINGSPTTANMWPYLVKNAIPEFDILAEDPSFATAKNLFSAGGAWDPNTGGSLTSAVIAKFLQQSSVKTMAMLAEPTPASEGFAHAVDASAAKDGVKVVYENDAIGFASFDATSVAIRLKQVKPDAVLFPIGLAPSISIVRAMQQQNFTPKVALLTTGYDPASLSAGLAGTYTTDQYVPYLGPVSGLPAPAQQFRNAMAQYYPKVDLGLAGPGGWAAASEFLYALQLAGKCPTQAGIISAMRSQAAYNAGGLEPAAVQYTPGITPDGNPLSCEYFVKINSSSFSVPNAPICL